MIDLLVYSISVFIYQLIKDDTL